MKQVKIHIVVARYLENLSWLFTLLSRKKEDTIDIRATIYNDGTNIDIPRDLEDKIVIYPGDKIPCEPTKYIEHVLRYWEYEQDEILVFLQGNPIYHNPTLINVFDHIDEWNKNYQNMTLYPHPPITNWGCSRQIEKGIAPNITIFENHARVWCDTNMDDHFRGKYFKDEEWHKALFGSRNITVSELCKELGFEKPSGNILKTYAAMFATNWKHIKKHPKSVWENMKNFIIHGNTKTHDMSPKERACILEYMWSVVLHDE